MSYIATDKVPSRPATLVAAQTPLIQSPETEFCPGCGEPIAIRILLEALAELSLVKGSVGVVGHGCYAGAVTTIDTDLLQCLHGRAPSCATGIKRMRPDCTVFTIQGDGDMFNEGLQEVLHTAARGENVTCVVFNNGVFGDTGGQMTAGTIIGQRTKNSIDGRDGDKHGYPIPVSELVASLRGTAYVARGAVHRASSIALTKNMIKRAFEHQRAGNGFSMVEILTMCPTGWFVPVQDGSDYMSESLELVNPSEVLKDVGMEGDID